MQNWHMDDWTRVLHYAPRIKKLHLCADEWTESANNALELMCSQLSGRQLELLTSKLGELSLMNQFPDPLRRYLHCFVSTNLRTLVFCQPLEDGSAFPGWPVKDYVPALSSFLNTFNVRRPHLSSIDCSLILSTEFGATAVLQDFIRRNNFLRRIAIRDNRNSALGTRHTSLMPGCLPHGLWQQMSIYPGLDSLVLATNYRSEIVPVLEASTYNGFNTLKKLAVEAAFISCVQLLRSTRHPLALENISLAITDKQLHGDFLVDVATSIQPQSLLVMHIISPLIAKTSHNNEPLTDDAMHSLGLFVNLESLCIEVCQGVVLTDDGIRHLVASLPNLRRLKLSSHPIQSPKMTHRGLMHIANGCPSLSFLELGFDASGLQDPSAQVLTKDVRVRSLKTFYVHQNSPVGDPVATTCFLIELAPLLETLIKVTLKPNDPNAGQKNLSSWQPIQNLIAPLRELRKRWQHE